MSEKLNTRELTICDLPNEILLQIFGYLDVEDICFAVTQVCKRWYCLSQDDSLWRNLNFVCSKNMSLEYIVHMFKKLSLLQSLKLQWRTDIDLIFRELYNSCNNIRQLDLVCCGQIKEATMKELAEHFPNLESFSLGKCWAIESTCLNAVCHFPNLKKINLSHSRSLDGQLLKQIINSCNFLQYINIDYVRGLTDDDIIYLIKSTKKNLLSLTLYGENLTDNAFFCMAECTVLNTLHLSSCLHMTDRGLKVLSELSSLKSFKLRLAKEVSTEALTKLILSKMACNLDYLILSRLPNMNDNVAYNIPLNCFHLKYLEIVYCPNVTLLSYECVVKGCRLLKVFHFRQNFSNAYSDIEW